MTEQEIRHALISNIFSVYGKPADQTRIQLYLAILADIPTEVLKNALRKIYLEEKFMPTPAHVVDATKSLLGSVNENGRQKEWHEAWDEITKAMYKYPIGKEPEWSTPQIAAAVHAFGWRDLQVIDADKFTTASAQIRRYYEDACKRTKECMTNSYVIGISNVKSLVGKGCGGSERVLGQGHINTPAKD